MVVLRIRIVFNILATFSNILGTKAFLFSQKNIHKSLPFSSSVVSYILMLAPLKTMTGAFIDKIQRRTVS